MYIVFKEAYISIHIYIYLQRSREQETFRRRVQTTKKSNITKNEETQGLHYFPNKRKTNKKEEKLFLLKSCNKLFVKKEKLNG